MRQPYRFAVTSIVGLGALGATLALGGCGGSNPALAEPAEAIASEAPAEVPAEASAQEAQEVGAGEGQTAEAAAQFQAEELTQQQEPQWLAIDAHNEATRGPIQPIPFNHRFHSTDLEIDCNYCHIGTESSVAGVIPSLELCMGCHRIAGSGLPPVEQLRGFASLGQPIPWEWVNKVPEFVQFSHQPHIRSAIDCTECHGPVEEMDRVYQWAPFTMGWCLECHRQERADTDVATDNLLVEQYPPPQPPEELQPHSLYPRALDSQYGATRGPTDCAACHY
jgi:hypothetical protein